MQALFTKHHFAQLPEGFPAQLIEGRLVRQTTPLVGHQRLVMRLCQLLWDIVGFELVLQAPVDCPIDELNVYQPDVVLFWEPPPLDESGTVLPRVVFEVLSPTTEARDRDPKLLRYIAAGVQEVWLIDPDTRAIEIHSRDGTSVSRGANAARSGRVRDLVLVPNEVFEPLN